MEVKLTWYWEVEVGYWESQSIVLGNHPGVLGMWGIGAGYCLYITKGYRGDGIKQVIKAYSSKLQCAGIFAIENFNIHKLQPYSNLRHDIITISIS